ncbi:hypothetical protein VZ95_10185 [Elstera litoralis]|uniref:Uncharacterized protein n=1 Tax=Elstera litoralis TaxID=552518 RepID=A0A0F3IVM0_9PROT|nr:hypothetical protein [Elstera litoralis]KJV09639.1 hypothetical protein VZ95_10185 [Elstera litoralis]
MNPTGAIISFSFENTKKCLFHGLAVLFLNGVTILLLLGHAENHTLALMPSVLTIPLLTRLCWLFGQEIRRLASLNTQSHDSSL